MRGPAAWFKSLTPAERDSLARMAVEEDSRDPAGYRRRVRLHVGALYGLFYGAAAFLLAAGGWLLVRLATSGWREAPVSLLFILAILILPLLVGVVARVPAPNGRTVGREEAPELFALLDTLARDLRIRRLSSIVIDESFQACVWTEYRFGPFGPGRRHLLIGLPLLAAMTRAEFTSVLAHELGHIAKLAGSLALRSYRLSTALDVSAAAGGAWGWLLRRHAPYFNAHVSVLTREQETEADLAAARLAGGEAFGDGLKAAAVLEARVERAMRELWARAAESEAAPAGWLTSLVQRLRDRAWTAEEERLFRVELAQPTENLDTHPCLARRLESVGLSPSRAALPEARGEWASSLLGPAFEAVARDVEAGWWAAVRPAWEMRGFQLKDYADELARLNALGDGAGKPEALERLRLALELHGPESARGELERCAARWPDDALTSFHLGSLLLREGDGRGAALLESVVARDPVLAPGACGALLRYFWGRGQTEQALRWRERALNEAARWEEQAEEAEEPIDGDTPLAAYSTDEQQAQVWKRRLEGVEGVRRVYVARRVLASAPDRPYPIVFWVPELAWWKSDDPGLRMEWTMQVAQKVFLSAPTALQERNPPVVAVVQELVSLEARLRELPGAVILDAPPSAYEKTRAALAWLGRAVLALGLLAAMVVVAMPGGEPMTAGRWLGLAAFESVMAALGLTLFARRRFPWIPRVLAAAVFAGLLGLFVATLVSPEPREKCADCGKVHGGDDRASTAIPLAVFGLPALLYAVRGRLKP
jgi:MFS family permease